MASQEQLLLDAIISHQVDLAHYSNGAVRRMLALLQRADADLVAKLAQALENMPAGYITADRLDMLLQDVRALQAAAVERSFSDLRDEMHSLTSIEGQWQHDLFKEMAPAEAARGLLAIDPQQVYSAALARPFQGRLLSEWASTIEDGVIARIRDAIRIGFVQNLTTDEIVRNIRGTRAANYEDGMLAIERRNAQAIVRTALAHTADFARNAFYQANPDVIDGQVWMSTLDDRTTPECFPASTRVLPIGDTSSVFARAYEGEMVVVTTAGGKQLRATPNHPVLTSRGWRAMKELQPRKDVLHRLHADSICLCCSEHVGVPAPIGAVADAFSHPSVAEVFAKSSSQADFHGDGMVGEYKVHIAKPDGNLGDVLDSVGFKKIAKALLVEVHRSGCLSANGLTSGLILGGGPVSEAAQLDSVRLEDSVQGRLGDLEVSAYFGRPHSTAEGKKHGGPIVAPWIATRNVSHDSGTNENSSDGRGGDLVVACNRCGGLGVRVSADDVVSVRSEFFSGHVFNLSTSSEAYFADGFIVHNCQERDQLEYTLEGEPIGHNVPFLGGPPIHWNCRSATAPIITGMGFDTKGNTRASMDGQVPASWSYKDWLKRQSAARQDEIMGPTRGRMLRRGDITVDKFWNNKGQYLTLDELQAKSVKDFAGAAS
jgi:hypothetical protein